MGCAVHLEPAVKREISVVLLETVALQRELSGLRGRNVEGSDLKFEGINV